MESLRHAARSKKLDVNDKLQILLITGVCIWIPSILIFLYFFIKDYLRRKELQRLMKLEELEREESRDESTNKKVAEDITRKSMNFNQSNMNQPTNTSLSCFKFKQELIKSSSSPATLEMKSLKEDCNNDVSITMETDTIT